jgi:hypothetical protein
MLFTDMPAKLEAQERRRRAYERTRAWRAKHPKSYQQQWRRSNQKRRDLQMRNKNDERGMAVALVGREQGAEAAFTPDDGGGAQFQEFGSGDARARDREASSQTKVEAGAQRGHSVLGTVRGPAAQADEQRSGVEVEGF